LSPDGTSATRVNGKFSDQLACAGGSLFSA
jgi:hypothetical protein